LRFHLLSREKFITCLIQGDEQKQDKAVKDQDVHPVLMQSIEEFKAFVKLQKNIASDITRSSCRPSERVDDDIEILKQRLFSIRNHIQSYSSQAKKLKTESSRVSNLIFVFDVYLFVNAFRL